MIKEFRIDAPLTVEITSPSEGEVLNSGDVAVTWEVTGGTQSSWELELWGEKGTHRWAGADDQSTSYTFFDLPDDGYLLKLSVEGDGDEAYDNVEFTIDITPPPTPALLSPIDGALINDNTPTFEWTPVEDPSGVTYTLQYSGFPDSANWRYRAPVVLTNAGSSELTDYQILVTLDTTSLIAVGKLREDAGDLRFTDSDGETQLPYWIESGVGTSLTRVWIRVPLVPIGETEIYMCYGNPSAESASDGEATFEFFDDFNDGVIDSDKWNKYGPVDSYFTESDGSLNYNGGWPGSYYSVYPYSKNSFGRPFVYEYSFRITGSSASYWGLTVVKDPSYNSAFTCSGKLYELHAGYLYYPGGYVGHSGWSVNTDYWLSWIVKKEGTDIYRSTDGGETWSYFVGTTESDLTPLQIAPLVSGDKSSMVDDVRVRKFASPEPTTSIGTEEEMPQENVIIKGLCDGSYTIPDEAALVDGTYYWRVQAVDGAGNESDWSEVWQFTVDTSPPTSSINPIEPYWQTSKRFTITATAADKLSGVQNVELWYRYSKNGTRWSDWISFGVDEENADGWSWSFIAKGGYYEFYSVVTDGVGNIEAAPSVVDAVCGVDRTGPVIKDENPEAGSTVPIGDVKVSFKVIDKLSGVDSSTIKMFVNGVRVTPNNQTRAKWL